MNQDIFDKSRIIGDQGSQYVLFSLNSEQSIISSLGSVIYINGDVDKAEVVFPGIQQGIMNIFSGESFIFQKFQGNGSHGKIAIGSSFINSVVCIKIEKDETYRLSRNSFLACTENIEIGTTIIGKGILGIGQSEGFIYPTAKVKSNDDNDDDENNFGYIWLSAYGGLEKISVVKDKELIINNGLFLACKNEVKYDIDMFGKSIISSIGEGFGMSFKGESDIYIQTKNINELERSFQQHNNSIGKTVIGSLVDGDIGEGNEDEEEKEEEEEEKEEEEKQEEEDRERDGEVEVDEDEEETEKEEEEDEEEKENEENEENEEEEGEDEGEREVDEDEEEKENKENEENEEEGEREVDEDEEEKENKENEENEEKEKLGGGDGKHKGGRTPLKETKKTKRDVIRKMLFMNSFALKKTKKKKK